MEDRRVTLRHFSFPRYWEEVVEPVQSAEWLLERIASLEEGFHSTEGEHISVFLDGTDGNSLNVGLAGDCWTVTHIEKLGDHDSEFQYGIGNPSGRGHVPILTPEWTDTSKKQLIDRSIAKEIVTEWVEKGTLSKKVRWTYDMP